MQPITYAMDFPKVRRAALVAIIGGILGAASISISLHLAETLQADGDRWFWLYVALALAVLVLLVGPLALAFLSSRVPIFRPIGFFSVMTAVMCLSAGMIVLHSRNILATGDLDWLAAPGLWPSRLDPSLVSGVFVAIAVAAVGLLATGAALREMRRSAAKQSLVLDDKGLSCEVWGKRWYWGWHESARPELRAHRWAMGMILGRHIALNPIVRGHRILLSDVWDKPLDEILAALKDRRDRALAGMPHRP